MKYCVQRLVALADSENIAKVRREIGSLAESFRRSVAFMDAAEVMDAQG